MDKIKSLYLEELGIALEVGDCGTKFITPTRKQICISAKGNEYIRTIYPKQIKPISNGLGYLQVRLSVNTKRKAYYAHRLVWEAFNGAIPEGFEIDHIDNNKANNSLKNLNLITRKENMIKCLKDNPHIANNLRKGKNTS